jgi:hypothetical protein
MIQCPGGFYCENPATNVLCQSGRYCQPGSLQESPCPAGSVCVTPSTVRQCVAGTFCPQNSSVEVQCAIGSYCQQGSIQESLCPLGSVCTTSSTIRQCVIGSYCPQGSSTESLCAVGFFCPNVTVQIPCPAEYFCDYGSTAPFPLNDGCIPPVVFLPFTQSLTRNLGYSNRNASVLGTCWIQQNMCLTGLVPPCMSGLRCDGSSSSYIGFPVYVNNSFSLSMWIWLYSLGYNPLFQLDHGLVEPVFSVHQNSNDVIVYLHLGPSFSISARFYFQERMWTHVAVSIEYISGIYTCKIYINGLEMQQKSMSGIALMNRNFNARIGSISSSVSGFYGGISQLGLFNYALSARQIFTIFKGDITSCKCPLGFYCNSTESSPVACPPGIYPP